MRIALTGVAVFALAAASASGVVAQTPSNHMMPGNTMMKGGTMPKCTPVTGPVVWWVASTKKYYLKGSASYGKGNGIYACRATAVARGGKPGAAGSMGGSMGHGATGGSMGHGAMGGESHGPMSSPATTAPRPMGSGSMSGPGSSGGSMGSPVPAATPSVGIPGGTNAAPGSRSPNPASSGSLSGASGNQGNTGAPGAGGMVPNNPGSSSNSTTPRPAASASPRP